MTEFSCEECGTIYPSPQAATACEMADTAEANQARREPKVKGPKPYVRAYD